MSVNPCIYSRFELINSPLGHPDTSVSALEQVTFSMPVPAVASDLTSCEC